MMPARFFLGFLLLCACFAPAHAQRLPNPADEYVQEGQDARGFERWLRGYPGREGELARFKMFLEVRGVGNVVPAWQLLRTASDWKKCNAQPFEIPQDFYWENIVRTLRFTKDHVVPWTGPLEAVSVYRNPRLNSCAGGSARSSHRTMLAVDFVPRWPFARSDLMTRLCYAHREGGRPADIGFGFYKGIRFHIDNAGYRLWGLDPEIGGRHCDLAITAREAAREEE